MYQHLQAGGQTPGAVSGHGASGVGGVIPYDRNLYLTVTSPDGQDKEILGAKACYQHSLALLEISWRVLKYVFSVGNCIGPRLGNQKQIDTFVPTPILRDLNSQVDNIPGRPEGDGEGVHGGVSGAPVLWIRDRNRISKQCLIQLILPHKIGHINP